MAIKKKEYSFDDLKKEFSTTTKYKQQQYLSCGEVFTDIAGVPGPAIGHINLILGHSDSGKTTVMIKSAVSSQSLNILPIFIITEKKWDWNHAKLMGLNCDLIKDTGEWDGFFIYRDDFLYVEQITDFINKILDAQALGKLNQDICFFWDSVGTVPCKLTFEGKGGKQHTAGVLAEKIGMGINQRINSTRKEGCKYTATMVVVNQPWVENPDNPFGQPKIKPKGGEALYTNSTLVFQMGNEKNSGISKIKATKNGRSVIFATRSKITVKKNHINGLGYSDGKVIVTPHGFIYDNKEAIDNYKAEHSDYWVETFGSSDFDLYDETEDLIDGISEEKD